MPDGDPVTGPDPLEEPGALDVFRNRPFLLLWLSQLFTQVGANMVLYGLTVIVAQSMRSTTANSLLILSFLVPAVVFSAVAGVYVDRLDKRWVLVATNVIRAGLSVILYLVGANFLLLLAVNVLISTATVFFAPAEAAMIPQVVPRKQLIAANGVFTLTLNAAFAVGFALLGPLVANVLGPPALILAVGFFYLLATGFCWTLPSAPPGVTAEAGERDIDTTTDASDSTFAQLREGVAFIRSNPRISWSLVYLGIAASLVGVLGVLGPDFAQKSLRLEAKDFVVVVLPLAIGIVMGILILNNFGHLFPRRRIIEGGLVGLGLGVVLIAAAGPISAWLQNAEATRGLANFSGFTSVLAIVIVIALLAGVAYAFVAIPAQTQLQEDLPEDVRGRVFGVLNMLVSTASFLPIIIVGPFADVLGTTVVLYIVGSLIAFMGIVSILKRGPLKPSEARQTATGPQTPAGLDPVAVATASEMESHERRAHRRPHAVEDQTATEGPPAAEDPRGGEHPPADLVAPGGGSDEAAPVPAASTLEGVRDGAAEDE